MMKPLCKRRKHGLIVQPDDLEVGQFYAVYGVKNSTKPVQIAGESFRITAMNLPFVVGKLVSDEKHPPITFDLRFLEMMRVTQDFVAAQDHPPIIS